MKIRFNIKDLIDILVFGEYGENMERYNIGHNELKQIKRALRRGTWKVV
ncbi:MAG: hypothetical protein ACE5PM_00325 [Candidatus Hydrothermarchaeales archaeon]